VRGKKILGNFRPLTRLERASLVLATLSHKRAFTPVFDGLWGEGKSAGMTG
jgi:hypothetical protein